MILAGQGIAHAHIGRHDTHADDAPIQGLALIHQFIEVHRLVSAMESANTEVDNARGDVSAVERWDLHSGSRSDFLQVFSVELEWGVHGGKDPFKDGFSSKNS